MRIRFLVLVVGAIAAGSLVGLAQSTPAELQLEAARRKAVIDGDLVAAMTDYQTLADRFRTTEPGVAAEALLRLAEAHEALGDGRARGVYERLASEHPTEPEGKTAIARAAGFGPQVARVLRPVWSGQGPEASGRVSADGRYLAYVDEPDLMLRDLSLGTNSILAKAPEDFSEFAGERPVLSRDGLKVAYVWYVDDGALGELRVIDRRQASAAPRVLERGPDFDWVQPLDWAPDGERLVVGVRRNDRTAQIGYISLADGAYQSLKTVDWRLPTNLEVSPDGQFIAYDVPINDTSRDREVYVLRLDGTRVEQRVSDRPGRHSVVGWTADGRTVLFATERAGTVGLQGTAMAGGTPQSPPRLIEPDLGAFHASRGITADGRLLFTKKIGGTNIFTAEVDFSTGTVVVQPERVTDGILSDHRGPMWSPDGRYLAFTSMDRNGPSLAIRSVETGATRVIEPALRLIQFPRWSSPTFITFHGSDFRGRQGIFRTDVQTGETSLIVGGDGMGYRSWADATPDGRRVVYANSASGEVVSRELVTGQERSIVSPGPFSAVHISPDGRMVAYRTGDRARQAIMVVPIEGGSPRAVLTVSEGLAHFVDWLPDGQRLLARTGGERDKLVVVRLDGVVDREIDLPGDFIGPSFTVHSDGRRVAFNSGSDEGYELWTLENFLPVPAR